MDKSTIVCRCEEINVDEIESAIQLGAHTFDDIKRLTRCGMGPCQSKICLNLVRSIISQALNQPLSDIGPSRMRMPIKLTRLGVLANDQEFSNDHPVFQESVSEEGDASRD